MKWFIAILLVLGMGLATSPAPAADRAQEAAGEETTGLTPLTKYGIIGCLNFCIDTYELKCTSSKYMYVDMFDDFADGETFWGVLSGITPTSIYAHTSQDWANGVVGSYTSIMLPGTGSIKALYSIYETTTAFFDDYSVTLYCYNASFTAKSGSINQKQNQ